MPLRYISIERNTTLFSAKILHFIGWPMRDLVDSALATVQAALESAVFTEAFAMGQQMSLAAAFSTLRFTVLKPNA